MVNRGIGMGFVAKCEVVGVGGNDDEETDSRMGVREFVCDGMAVCSIGLGERYTCY